MLRLIIQGTAPERLRELPPMVHLLLYHYSLRCIGTPKNSAIAQGRRWAEDGLFLLDALQRPWWQALATLRTGYIDAVASGAMLIATRLADLEHVALVSVLLALVIQLCPAMLLITSRCAWLQPRWVLAAACC